MNNIWLIAQAVISVLIIVSVLLQSQGGGLGQSFGSSGGDNYHTRRGLEKVLYNGTIILIASFAIVSIGSLVTK